jgi:hypothetical protein
MTLYLQWVMHRDAVNGLHIQVIETGDRVKVDADKGTIEITKKDEY